jgi:hypothetical protein
MTPLLLIPAFFFAGFIIKKVVADGRGGGGRPDDAAAQIKRGHEAIAFVRRTKRNRANAMHRDDIGVIGFRWGRASFDRKKGKSHGHGWAKIIARAGEAARKTPGYPSAGEILSSIPETIMRGTVQKQKGRVTIQHGSNLVILSAAGRNPKNPHWLFHAYELT